MIEGSFYRRAGDSHAPQTGQRRFHTSRLLGASLLQDSRQASYLLSDNSVARDNATIATKGWELAEYRKCPVVLFAHDATRPPVARCVEIGIVGNELRGTAEFAPPETSQFADEIYRLVKGGFLNACSVSWLPLEWRYSTDKSRAPYSIDFLRQTLLEFSVVPIPAAPNALLTAREQGIDTRVLRDWAERVLDGEAPAGQLRRQTIEQIRIAASEPRLRTGKAISAANADRIGTAREHAQNCVDALEDLLLDGSVSADPETETAEAEARAARIRHAAELKRRHDQDMENVRRAEARALVADHRRRFGPT